MIFICPHLWAAVNRIRHYKAQMRMHLALFENTDERKVIAIPGSTVV